MTRAMVPDLWAWAACIIENDLEFAYAGVDRPSSRDRCNDKKDTFLSWHLTASDQYMNRHCENAAKYYMESDADDDWREACEHETHSHDLCPEKDPEGYKAAVEEMYNDENQRQQWASDRVEPSWEWDQIREDCTEIYFVHWLLKEHPITAIRANGEWIDIDDVVGFCPGCSEPILAADVTVHSKDSPYAEGARTLYCNPCGYDAHLLDTDDEAPFYWPPGAPVPRHPDGQLAPPPPPDYEEYMNEARERRRRLREDAANLHREGEAVQQG